MCVPCTRFGVDDGLSHAPLSTAEVASLTSLAHAANIRLAFLYSVRTVDQAALAAPVATWAAQLPFLSFTLHSTSDGGRVHAAPALAHAYAWVGDSSPPPLPAVAPPAHVGVRVPIDGGRAVPVGPDRGVAISPPSLASAPAVGSHPSHATASSAVASVDVFTCGPSGFAEGVGTALGVLGLDPARLHTESFTY